MTMLVMLRREYSQTTGLYWPSTSSSLQVEGNSRVAQLICRASGQRNREPARRREGEGKVQEQQPDNCGVSIGRGSAWRFRSGQQPMSCCPPENASGAWESNERLLKPTKRLAIPTKSEFPTAKRRIQLPIAPNQRHSNPGAAPAQRQGGHRQ